MSVRLRELARRALVERRPDAGTDAEIERLVVDVRLGERVEMVTISVREGRLVLLASDGPATSSPAASAVLRWLASDGPRSSLPPEPRPNAPAVVESASAALEIALADLATAVVRAGTEAADAPAVVDALARIEGASRSLEIARFGGRLRAALAAKDAVGVARLLESAAGLEREGEPERRVDQILVELGRELVDGWAPGSIERRHLVDPATLESWVEERRRDEPTSHGPFPRVVSAGLVTCTAHGRIRIVQYAVAPLDAEMLAKVGARAERSVAQALAQAKAQGLGTAAREPCSLVRLDPGSRERPTDAAGMEIPLARHEDAGAASALVLALGKGEPEWLFGRWTLLGAEASLVPLACCVGGRVTRLR